jgi:hypothetical protein
MSAKSKTRQSRSTHTKRNSIYSSILNVSEEKNIYLTPPLSSSSVSPSMSSTNANNASTRTTTPKSSTINSRSKSLPIDEDELLASKCLKFSSELDKITDSLYVRFFLFYLRFIF